MADISIHALHYRVRFHFIFMVPMTRYFNPRTPLQSAIVCPRLPILSVLPFQSTHSITECDLAEAIETADLPEISIHALHYRVR